MGYRPNPKENDIMIINEKNRTVSIGSRPDISEIMSFEVANRMPGWVFSLFKEAKKSKRNAFKRTSNEIISTAYCSDWDEFDEDKGRTIALIKNDCKRESRLAREYSELANMFREMSMYMEEMKEYHDKRMDNHCKHLWKFSD